MVLVLPLAIILALPAPALTMTSSPVLKDTTLGDAASPSHSAAAAAKILEDVQTISAVQDWSLLCKELCGAGLGVALAPDGAKDLILRLELDVDVAKCRQLCGLPRGGVGDLVCSSFCVQRGRSPAGCSPCQQEVRRKEEDGKMEETTASGVQGDPTHGSSSPGTTLRRSVDQATSSVASSVARSTTDSTTPAPDWNEVCKVLCKTGDGGSLCNCDLSPFFS